MYDYENSPEPELIRRAGKGDVKAFSQLYAGIYKDLYRFALCVTRHTQDAEDAVGDAVADAFASIKKLRDAGAFRPWIFRILSNKCRRKLKEYLRKTRELPEEIPWDGKELFENYAVRSAFFALDSQDRLILSLHLFAGYTSREIGRELNMNENTVRSRESRALKKLADMLKE